MVNERLKYRIKEALVRKHGSESAIRRAKEALEADYGIPMGTLNHDVNIRLRDATEIPDLRLQKYATALGVSIAYLKEDYINHLKQAV